MLDIKFIRENSDLVKRAVKDKNREGTVDIGKLLELDRNIQELSSRLELIRRQRNELDNKIKTEKDQIARASFISQNTELKGKLKKLEGKLAPLNNRLQKLIRNVPNIPAPDVKPGKDESENGDPIKLEGKPAKFSFEVRDHIELGRLLNIIDVQRSSKVSGTRFGYLIGDGVLLEFALVQYALSVLTQRDFIPMIPPALTLVSTFHGLGYSEHGGNEEYYLVYDPTKENPKEEANYYLIGTSEHSIVPYYMDETLTEKDLPKRFVGFSPCFRREVGSYGKDVKGLIRVHHFDKVEMISFTKPEDSDKEHDYLLSLQENLFQSLRIPYQVIKACTGDLGFPVARKYDIEVWIPSQQQYREMTSTSSTTDFQARRLGIRYRDKEKSSSGFVHILNGTAFAIGRTLVAILENYQQKDGSVTVPEVLQKYVGKGVIKPQ